MPRQFWKVAAWATHNNMEAASSDTAEVQLAATGYLLDQTQLLDTVLHAETRSVTVEEPPPLGQYLTYQVPIVDIATLTGLNLGPLVAADRLTAEPPVPANTLRPGTETVATRWVQLHTFNDLRL